jgi:MFS transporter, DHA1 family, multidrug resistance protein
LPKPNTFFLAPVYLIVFSAFFDTHAQMPVLAPYATTLGATPFMLGIVVGAYSLFNIIGNFAGGAAIDHRGWKMPLLLGLTGVSLVLLFYTCAGSAGQLALIRGGHGFMGGILVPAALACLTVNSENTAFQGQRLAYFGASIGLAAVTGPLTAGIIAGRYGYPAVYFTLAALMLLATFTAFKLTRSSDPCISSFVTPQVSLKQVAGSPKLQGAFVFAFGTMGSTGTLASFLPTRAALLGLNSAQTGMLFATFAFTAIIIQMLWPTILKQRLKYDYCGCALGLILISASLTLAASLGSTGGLFGALALFGVGFGFSFQGMLGLVMTGSQLTWRGRAIGLFFAVYSLGVAIVPPLSGLIWQRMPVVFPFYIAAAIALFCIILGLKYSKHPRLQLSEPLKGI